MARSLGAPPQCGSRDVVTHTASSTILFRSIQRTYHLNICFTTTSRAYLYSLLRFKCTSRAITVRRINRPLCSALRRQCLPSCSSLGPTSPHIQCSITPTNTSSYQGNINASHERLFLLDLTSRAPREGHHLHLRPFDNLTAPSESSVVPPAIPPKKKIKRSPPYAAIAARKKQVEENRAYKDAQAAAAARGEGPPHVPKTRVTGLSLDTYGTTNFGDWTSGVSNGTKASQKMRYAFADSAGLMVG